MKRQRSDAGRPNEAPRRKRPAFSQHQLTADAPRAIDPIAHAAARIAALTKLEVSLIAAGIGNDASAAQTAKLPSHLRRRTSSHARRAGGTRRIRETGYSTTAGTDDDSSRPREHRRKPALLRIAWAESSAAAVRAACSAGVQGGPADGAASATANAAAPSKAPVLRLATHLWHAKRFSMESMPPSVWEMPCIVPVVRRDAGVKAALRWSGDWGVKVGLGAVLQHLSSQGGQDKTDERECIIYDASASRIPLKLSSSSLEGLLEVLQDVLDPAAAEACGKAFREPGAIDGTGDDESAGSLSRAAKARRRRADARAKWRATRDGQATDGSAGAAKRDVPNAPAMEEGEAPPLPLHNKLPNSTNPSPIATLPLEVCGMLHEVGSFPHGAVAPVTVHVLPGSAQAASGPAADGARESSSAVSCIIRIPAAALSSCWRVLQAAVARHGGPGSLDDGPSAEASAADMGSTRATPAAIACTADHAAATSCFAVRGHPSAVAAALQAVLTRDAGAGAAGADGIQTALVALAKGRTVVAESTVAIPSSEAAAVTSGAATPSGAAVASSSSSSASSSSASSSSALPGAVHQPQEYLRALWEGRSLGPADKGVAGQYVASDSDDDNGDADDDAAPLPDFLSLAVPGGAAGAGSSAASGQEAGAAAGSGKTTRNASSQAYTSIRIPVLLSPVAVASEGEHRLWATPQCRTMDLPCPGGIDITVPACAARAVWQVLVTAGRCRAIGLEGWRALHTARGLPCFPAGHPDTPVGSAWAEWDSRRRMAEAQAKTHAKAQKPEEAPRPPKAADWAVLFGPGPAAGAPAAPVVEADGAGAVATSTGAGTAADTAAVAPPAAAPALPLVVHGLVNAHDFLTPSADETDQTVETLGGGNGAAMADDGALAGAAGSVQKDAAMEGAGDAASTSSDDGHPPLLRVFVRCVGRGGAPVPGAALYLPGAHELKAWAANKGRDTTTTAGSTSAVPAVASTKAVLRSTIQELAMDSKARWWPGPQAGEGHGELDNDEDEAGQEDLVADLPATIISPRPVLGYVQDGVVASTEGGAGRSGAQRCAGAGAGAAVQAQDEDEPEVEFPAGAASSSGRAPSRGVGYGFIRSDLAGQLASTARAAGFGGSATGHALPALPALMSVTCALGRNSSSQGVLRPVMLHLS